MVRVANLRARCRAFLRDNQLDALDRFEKAKEIGGEAQQLDAALDAWSDAVPDEWRFSARPLAASSSAPDSDPPPTGYVHHYASHAHATMWNRYRAVRLITNSIRMRVVELLVGNAFKRSCVLLQQRLSQNNINRLTDELCACVPFFSSGVDAHGPCGERSLQGAEVSGPSLHSTVLPKMAGLLAWPLAVAVSTEAVPEPQRQWLERKLKIVASSLGDSILESVAEKREFRF